MKAASVINEISNILLVTLINPMLKECSVNEFNQIDNNISQPDINYPINWYHYEEKRKKNDTRIMVHIVIICGIFFKNHNLRVAYGNQMTKVVNVKRFVRTVSSAFTFSLQHVFHNGIEMNETDELSDVQFKRYPNCKVKVKASEDTMISVKSDVELSINNEIYFVS